MKRSSAVPLMVLTLGMDGFASELHADLCPHGCPAGAPRTNDVVVGETYVLGSNDATKFAEWVAYRVVSDSIGLTAPRRWKGGSALSGTETLQANDYRGAHV